MAHSQRAITRRRFVQATAVSSLALAGLSFSRASRAQTSRPNIVFIMADDLGYADLSCYGQRDYTTPNIDRLAIEGVRFTQGYANSAVCSATRAALITGRYQYRLVAGLEEPIAPSSPKNAGLPPSHPTLPSLVKKVGYGTILVGKWHLGFLPEFSKSQNFPRHRIAAVRHATTEYSVDAQWFPFCRDALSDRFGFVSRCVLGRNLSRQAPAFPAE